MIGSGAEIGRPSFRVGLAADLGDLRADPAVRLSGVRHDSREVLPGRHLWQSPVK